MGEYINFGDFSISTNENITPGDVWLGRGGAGPPSRRLLKAFANGETTVGGLAEAGWHVIGKIDKDGLKWAAK